MPIYEFRGRNYDTGQVISGERFAQNERVLATMLRSERVMPIRIGGKSKSMEISLPKGGASSKDLALFTRQFSVMLDSGLPLVQCLSILSEQQEKPGLKDALEQLRVDVEAGSTLAEAMRKHPKVFDDLFVNMIAAGEAGGILDTILQRLSIFMEKSVKLKRGIVSAAIYPTVVVLVAIIIVFVIMVFVIPVFATLFDGMNAPLPLPTRLVMGASSFMAQFSIPIVIAAVLGTFGVRYYYKTDSGHFLIDRLLLAVPVIGNVIRKVSIARFSRTLSTLMTSGIPILDGLRITAETAGNVVIKNGLLQARTEVEQGKTLAEPLRKIKAFPSMVTQIVGVGEQTGELDSMLNKLADYYEEEADAAVANLLTMIEPVMIVFLGVVIGGIVISMYLPIFSLIGNMSAV